MTALDFFLRVPAKVGRLGTVGFAVSTVAVGFTHLWVVAQASGSV
jgi:hypothetical protein